MRNMKVGRKLHSFFKDNETGYAYFIFAQVIIIAAKFFVKYALKNPPAYITHSLFGLIVWVIFDIIYPICLPIYFGFAAFSTFKYPSSIPGKIIFISVNATVYFLILFSAVINL